MDNRPTFRWKIRKSPFTDLEKAWRTRCTSSFKSVARFTIIRQMAPLLSELSASMDSDLIAAVYFCDMTFCDIVYNIVGSRITVVLKVTGLTIWCDRVCHVQSVRQTP